MVTIALVKTSTGREIEVRYGGDFATQDECFIDCKTVDFIAKVKDPNTGLVTAYGGRGVVPEVGGNIIVGINGKTEDGLDDIAYEVISEITIIGEEENA